MIPAVTLLSPVGKANLGVAFESRLLNAAGFEFFNCWQRTCTVDVVGLVAHTKGPYYLEKLFFYLCISTHRRAVLFLCKEKKFSGQFVPENDLK